MIAIIVVTFIVLVLPVIIAALLYESRERRYRAATGRETLRQGLSPIPDFRSVIRRTQGVLEPLGWPVGSEKDGQAFSVRVGGRDAFFVEISHDIPQPFTIGLSEGGGPHAVHGEWRAYVVLGPGAPQFIAAPKGVFGKPADPIAFPEDRPFSKAFWVEGSDKQAIRRYVGPELRSFLLAQGSPWRFHAGQEGVVLVREGRTPTAAASKIASQVAKTLERLVMAIEAAARGRP